MEFFFTLILTWIVVYLMVKAGERKPRYKYKEMTPEEMEESAKRLMEIQKQNLEKWERLKAEADAESARLKAQQ